MTQVKNVALIDEKINHSKQKKKKALIKQDKLFTVVGHRGNVISAPQCVSKATIHNRRSGLRAACCTSRLRGAANSIMHTIWREPESSPKLVV